MNEKKKKEANKANKKNEKEFIRRHFFFVNLH